MAVKKKKVAKKKAVKKPKKTSVKTNDMSVVEFLGKRRIKVSRWNFYKKLAQIKKIARASYSEWIEILKIN